MLIFGQKVRGGTSMSFEDIFMTFFRYLMKLLEMIAFNA